MADKPFDPDEYLASKTFDPDAYLREEAPAPQVPPEVLADPNAVAALRLARGVKSSRKVSGADSTIRALENRAEAGAFGAGNAATFGMMNRGFGLADDIRTGAPWGTGTDKMVAREAEVQKQYPGYHLAGSVLGGVGTGVGLARGGIGISREGLGLAGRVGAGAAEGAAFGAASGAGQTYSGNLPDYIKNAAVGGAFGTVGGAVGEGVGAAAGNIYNRVRDARSAAFPEPVIRGARADVEGLENLPRLGPDAMLPDAGPSMQATAQQAALGIGPNRTSIVNALMERDLGTVPRLRADTEAAIGPAPRVSAVEEGIDAGRRQINTEYKPVLEGRVLDPSEANRVMAQLNHLEQSRRVDLGAVRESLVLPGSNGLPDLSPQAWLQARHRLDSMIEAANSPVQPDRYRAMVLGDVRRMIDDELAAVAPGVKAVDAKFAANRAELDALQTGRNVLDTGKQAVHPEDLRDLLQTQAAPQGLAPAGPPAANLRLRQGARAEIDRRVGTKANDLVELERTMGTPQDWNAQKLNQIFGPEAAQAVRDSVARNRQFRETYQRIAQGSDTAQRQAAAKTADVSAQQMPIRNLAGTAEQLGRMGLAQVMEARKQAQREAIATLMATRDPAEVARLRAALLAHIRAGAPGAARAAQTGRGVLQGVGMGIGPAADDYLQW
jgi:hypothetical protein